MQLLEVEGVTMTEYYCGITAPPIEADEGNALRVKAKNKTEDLEKQLADARAEIERLRELVVCSECGSWPDWNIKPIAAGWMANLCPDCQSDIMYGSGQTKLEAYKAFVAAFDATRITSFVQGGVWANIKAAILALIEARQALEIKQADETLADE